MPDHGTRQQVEELLASLKNSSLLRAHNSLNISFAQMGTYIGAISKSEEIPPDIRLLLETYQDLAERFYTQFEFTLLKEIQEQRAIPGQVDLVIKRLSEDGKTAGVNMELVDAIQAAKHILIEKKKSAVEDYQSLLANYPALLQSALDKLKDEWQRLNTIVSASQVLENDRKLLQSLNRVVEAAAYSVGIDAKYIDVIPGNSFALYFFKYLRNYAVLTVPIYSVRAPWEWSIFWHELAGYRVRQLEMDEAIKDIQAKLRVFHDFYKKLPEKAQMAYLDEITLNHGKESEIQDSQFIRDHLHSIFHRDRLNLEDLGNFEHQFGQMMGNISDKDKFQTFEQTKQEGWNVGWYKELFEDAWSILAIRDPFLTFFENILSRHTSSDGRHPPMDVRMRVARQMLNLLTQNGEVESITPVEKSAAEQILRFISLLMAASYKLPTPEDNKENIVHVMRGRFARAMGQQVGKSITKWSTKFIKAKNRTGDAQEGADDFIETQTDPELADFLDGFKDADESEKNGIPNIDELLKGKNYRELLALSFFDADFGTAAASFAFIFRSMSYSISAPNLDAAVKVKFIFETAQAGAEKIQVNNRDFWTTSANIDAMKDPSRRWVT